MFCFVPWSGRTKWNPFRSSRRILAGLRCWPTRLQRTLNLLQWTPSFSLIFLSCFLCCCSHDRSNWNDSDNHTVPHFILGSECLEHTIWFDNSPPRSHVKRVDGNNKYTRHAEPPPNPSSTTTRWIGRFHDATSRCMRACTMQCCWWWSDELPGNVVVVVLCVARRESDIVDARKNTHTAAAGEIGELISRRPTEIHRRGRCGH